jgi:hypothetical protein
MIALPRQNSTGGKTRLGGMAAKPGHGGNTGRRFLLSNRLDQFGKTNRDSVGSSVIPRNISHPC